MRSTTHVHSDREKPPSTTPTEPPPPRVDALPPPSPPLPGPHSLETLLSEAQYSPRVVDQFEGGEIDGENGDLKKDVTVLAKHLDVNEEEGWITIPYSTCSNLFTEVIWLV